MLDGRVKTLHPKIHAGILNVRKNKNLINIMPTNEIKIEDKLIYKS